MTGHTPAWALIPWYGDDGLGAPTLDDWRVWADWLATYDTDPDRDAAIARGLAHSQGLGVGLILVLSAYRTSIRRRSLPNVRMHSCIASDGGLLGFEVQPTRREMQWPMVTWATAATIGPFAPHFGAPARRMSRHVDLAAELTQAAQVSLANSSRIIRETAEAFADTGAAARTFGRTLHHVNSTTAGAPRNPRRRGDTGAHGRARR